MRHQLAIQIILNPRRGVSKTQIKLNMIFNAKLTE